MTESKIEWTGRSDWNPLRGCTRVSPGCVNCYAETIAARFSDEGQAFHGFAERTSKGGRWTGKVELVEDRLSLPLRWRKPATIFASSTSDIFHESLSDRDIDRIVAVMAATPHHTYQVLTKRAARMRQYWTELPARQSDLSCDASLDFVHLPLPNVWLGVSVEDQPRADERVGWLLDTPAAVRFLSVEPLLGPIDLTHCADAANPGFTVSAVTGWGGFDHPREGPQSRLPKVHWVVVGGESGHRARPMHPRWVRDLREQCRQAQVPFFFKQWGEWAPSADGNRSVALDGRNMPNVEPSGVNGKGTARISRVGKKAAGRLLDGVQHDGMPS